MNSIALGTIEEPGLDTHKVSTFEAPSGGAVNMHTIKGQVAVITGAAGGIGQALALDMARRGAAGIALVDFSDRVVQVARVSARGRTGRPCAQAGGERLRFIGGRDQRSRRAAQCARITDRRRHHRGVAPWRFRAPLSPDLAAARESRSIDFDELVAFSRKEIARPRRHSVHRRRRRHHGAARCRAHRARLDGGAANSASAGGRRLSRHHQPHPHRA